MSTLEVDSILASTSNSDLNLDGAGSGVVNLATGAELNGTALTSTFLTPTGDGSGLTGISAGAWSVLTSGTFSSTAQLDFAVSKTTKVIFENIVFSSDAGYRNSMRLSTDSGSTYITTSTYESYNHTTKDALGTRFGIGLGSFGAAAGEVNGGEITILKPNVAARTLVLWSYTGPNTAGTIAAYAGGGQETSSSVVNHVQLYSHIGASDYVSGTYTVLELN